MLVSQYSPPGLGWRQDVRDFRDFTPQSESVQKLFALAGGTLDPQPIPPQVDLREFFSPVCDQGNLNSSTAHACASLSGYFQFRTTGSRTDPSRLFLYRTTRKLLRIAGDTGADIRSTLKAIKRFGLPPESYWPYEQDKLDLEPDAFLYFFENPYRDMTYVRLDARNTSGSATLATVRAFLAAGFPVAFGFPVADSITSDGHIPYRPAFDSVRGGQAVVAVGYDDRWLGATRGGLLVRNSWGPDWGDRGYGWLPYRYVEEQLASDFWTVLSPEWLASGEFARPSM